LALDAADPLARFRGHFHIPGAADGSPMAYFAGNSLGLQPKSARIYIEEVLAGWGKRGVDGHFEGSHPWYPYHELFRDSGAKLVGANPGEVVMMNSLTVNLHLMMVSFFRPTRERYKILIDAPCFPSDTYALKTQLRYHGLDPEGALRCIAPREGETTIRMADISTILQSEGRQIALVLLAGVNFVTGQFFDLAAITEAGHRAGCIVGFDLAHAAGNVPLRLHDWGIDFAVWCSYKYLNAGPGAVAGCFVHERHASDATLPRFAGWWGNDPATRFRMHLEKEFVPREGADGWQVSNPPVLALAPLRASLDLFDEAGMDALRHKSLALTGYLSDLLEPLRDRGVEVITPDRPAERGCQLSLRFRGRARDVLEELHEAGVVCDFREPDVIRAAPVPLYNTFHDVWRLATTLDRLLPSTA
jgi:kynureninase